MEHDLANIAQMGSAVTADPASPPLPEQSERMVGGKSHMRGHRPLIHRAIRAALVLLVDRGAWFSPSASAALMVRFRQAAATGEPRSRSIRRIILTNSVRDTAT